MSSASMLALARARGKRGADVRPDFGWKRQPVVMMGYHKDSQFDCTAAMIGTVASCDD
jgi:hypothetical protein